MFSKAGKPFDISKRSLLKISIITQTILKYHKSIITQKLNKEIDGNIKIGELNVISQT